jgi:hypothetical protein
MRPNTPRFLSVSRVNQVNKTNPKKLPFTVKPLFGFVGNEHKNQPCGIAYSLPNYVNLVEATGKIIREDKRGSIDEKAFPLLAQLGFKGEDWLYLAAHFGKEYHQAVGSLAEPSRFASHTHKKWISGQRQQANIFH